MAVASGAYGDEATAWARIQLAKLYEHTGDRKNALMHYTIALQERPGYAHALAGLARVAMAGRDHKKAIAYLQQAIGLSDDYSFKEQLAQLYYTMGNKGKADEIMKAVIETMKKDAKKGQDDENIGHYTDRELAYAYLMTGAYEKAKQHALAEYNRRPENIDVNETLAWVLYKNEAYEKAVSYLARALRTNCKNPVLLCRGGLIYAKAGDVVKAKKFLEEGLKNDPDMEASLKEEASQIFKKL